jgi:hypothetical protein
MNKNKPGRRVFVLFCFFDGARVEMQGLLLASRYFAT